MSGGAREGGGGLGRDVEREGEITEKEDEIVLRTRFCREGG